MAAPPDPLPVSFLFSRACPSHDEGLALLRTAAEDAGVALDLTVVEVVTDAQAEALRFPGSPTYLIADGDPFVSPVPAHAFAFDACRAYARPGGRIGPLPHLDDLVAALRAGRDRP